MNSEFKVDSGRPIPTNSYDSPFPFKEMNVGDSFDVGHSQMKVSSVCSRIGTWNKRNRTTKFITRQVNGQGRGVKLTRVWRVV
tara:strand:+ start:1261 stop:1509 length:249 start_codon:yes stop_codon:yes gene_type:complete